MTTVTVHPAHTPEARAKRAATMAARKLAKANGQDAANAKRSATMKAKWRKRKDQPTTTRVMHIPLDAIPDDKPVRKYTKKATAELTREQMALEIVRLTMLLAKGD